MNDLYKPVDVKRLMELAGTRKLPEADAPVDYRANASPEVQANYNKGGQRPDPTDALIANRMGANVPQADLAKAAQTRPAGPTATVPTATAAAPAAPTAAISVPDAQDFGSEPKKDEPTVTTTPVSAPAPVTATPVAPAATPAATPAAAPAAASVTTRPAYAGSAGSQAIQKLNPAIKDVNKIQAGQRITLPGGGTYTVKAGDTLDKIAATQRAPAATPVATQPASPQTRQQRLDAMTPSQRQAVYPSRLDQLLYGKQAADAAKARIPALKETDADLGRMQSLAGIRKN